MTVQLFFIALGLSMDAVAVSIINGMCCENVSIRKTASSCGIIFGLFQGLMPVLGFLLGSLFQSYVKSVDHWIALLLLCFIGINMIREGIEERRNPEECPVSTTGKTFFLQGLATSIDALAIGISFALVETNILFASIAIGTITCVLSLCGVYVGHRFGRFFADKVQFIGGGLLIFLGLQIFYQHTFLGVG